MESTYVVWFGSDMLGLPLLSFRVNARTFLAVEDWAFKNAPEDYHVNSIEKNYGSDDALALFGDIDIDLEDADLHLREHSLRVLPGETYEDWKARQ